MKEATLFEVAFLVSATPPSGKAIRVGYWWRGSGGLNQNMTIPRQLTLGEGDGQIKEKPSRSPVQCIQVVQGEKWT